MPHIDDGTLHALLDGALRAEEPGRADAVDAHLDACADCRARLEHAAALRDQASDVLATLDAGLAGHGDPGTPTPDFGEVLARGGTGPHTGAPPAVDPDRAAGLRRRLGWTRGLAWAATIVVALGTGYIIRDMAGPTGQMPRAATRPEAESDLAPVELGTDPGIQPPPTDAEDAAAPSVTAGAGEGAGPEEDAAKTPRPEEAEAVQEAEAILEAEAARAETLIRAREQAMPLNAAPTTQLRQEAGGAVPTAGVRTAADGAAGEGAAGVPSPGRALMSSTAVRGMMDIAAVPGCYRLELGEWSPPRGARERAYQAPPDVFELMDSIGPAAENVEGRGLSAVSEQGRPLLRPLIEPEDDWMGGHPLGYWTIASPDSVHLVWSNGFAGVSLEMAVRGDTLEGTARGSSDVSAPPLPTTPARAVRVSCEAGGG